MAAHAEAQREAHRNTEAPTSRRDETTRHNRTHRDAHKYTHTQRESRLHTLTPRDTEKWRNDAQSRHTQIDAESGTERGCRESDAQ